MPWRRTWRKYRPLFIGGEWVNPTDGETDDDVNPATGKTIAKVAVAGKQDIERAVSAAQKAYDEVWFDTPPKERSAILLKLADAIDADAAELARLESIDVGKPITVSKADIPFISDSLRFFAGAARCQEGKSTGEYERGFTSMIRREPLGVTVGICPWNYPLMMAVWKLGPASGGREHLDNQAGADHTADHASPGRPRRRHCPRGRVQRRHRPGRRHRRRSHAPPGGPPRIGHRRHGHRQGHRRRLRRDGQACPPRARRQGPRRGLRRRRRGGPGRDPQVRRLCQHRPGLHGVLPRGRRARRSTTTCCPGSCPPSSRSRSATSPTPRSK